jgi:hypothetical protein
MLDRFNRLCGWVAGAPCAAEATRGFRSGASAKRTAPAIAAWFCTQPAQRLHWQRLTPVNQEQELMSKKKQENKKKDRQRRVAQKKHAEAEKRAQLTNTAESPKALPKTNLFTGSVSGPKTQSPAKTQRPFNHRRTGGG